MKILHIDASAKKPEQSNSRALGRYFLEQLQNQGTTIEIDYLDVTIDIQPHITPAFTVATYTPEHQRTDQMKATLMHSDAMCQRVINAEALVCAMPMYNWTIPSTFKTFIDTIIRTGITYDLLADGTTQGNLKDKKVLFITTRGADLSTGSPYQDMDAMTLVLKNSFAFIGVNHPQFVNAQPLQFCDPESRLKALEKARKELTIIAKQWTN